MLDSLDLSWLFEFDDFFDRIGYMCKLNVELIEAHPHITPFTMTMMETKFNGNEGVARQYIKEAMAGAYVIYFEGVKYSKFEESDDSKKFIICRFGCLKVISKKPLIVKKLLKKLKNGV